MKKLFIVIIMLVIMIFFTGCEKVKDENGDYVNLLYGLVEIKEVTASNRLLYDFETKVVYMQIHSGYTAGLSPYYIIGENGKPEIAVYGVNYMKNSQ